MRDSRLNKLKAVRHYRNNAFIDGLDRQKHACIDGLTTLELWGSLPTAPASFLYLRPRD